MGYQLGRVMAPVLLAVGLVACGGDGWSEEDRETLLGVCDDAADKGTYPGAPPNEQGRQTCYCAVNWLEDEGYAVDDVDRGAMSRAFKECA